MTTAVCTPTPSSTVTAGVIHRFRDFLPVTASTPVITLAEGSTPLIH